MWTPPVGGACNYCSKLNDGRKTNSMLSEQMNDGGRRRDITRVLRAPPRARSLLTDRLARTTGQTDKAHTFERSECRRDDQAAGVGTVAPPRHDVFDALSSSVSRAARCSWFGGGLGRGDRLAASRGVERWLPMKLERTWPQYLTFIL